MLDCSLHAREFTIGDGVLELTADRGPGGDGEQLVCLLARQHLPQLLGDERHHRMQQPQRRIETVREHGLRCRGAISGHPRLHGFDVPVRELVPRELVAALRRFVEAKLLERSRGVADHRLRAGQDPAIGEGEQPAIDRLDAGDVLRQLAENELPDVPELVREVAPRRERRLEIVGVDLHVGAQ